MATVHSTTQSIRWMIDRGMIDEFKNARCGNQFNSPVDTTSQLFSIWCCPKGIYHTYKGFVSLGLQINHWPFPQISKILVKYTLSCPTANVKYTTTRYFHKDGIYDQAYDEAWHLCPFNTLLTGIWSIHQRNPALIPYEFSSLILSANIQILAIYDNNDNIINPQNNNNNIIKPQKPNNNNNTTTYELKILIKYFTVALVVSILFTYCLTYILSSYVHPQCFEIVLVFSSFLSYHSDSLSSVSILFNISLWIAVELYEIINFVPNLSDFQSFIVSSPIIVLLCGGIIMMSMKHVRAENKLYRLENSLPQQQPNIVITNTNNNTNRNTNTNRNVNSNTNINKNEQKGISSFIADGCKIGLAGFGFCTGFGVLSTLVIPIISFLGIKWYLKSIINQFMNYVEQQMNNTQQRINNTKEGMENSFETIVQELKQYTGYFMDFVKEHHLFEWIMRCIFMFLGSWCGIYITSWLTVPYYIPTRHYQVLCLQQNISYLWWILYFSSGLKELKEYIFVTIVTLPLDIYLIDIISKQNELMLDDHLSNTTYLLIQIGSLSACYLVSQVIASFMILRE
eukprot:183612_1